VSPAASEQISAPRTSEPDAVLSEAQRAAIAAAVAALPPMTEEQVDAVCEVIVTARARWRRTDAPGAAPRGGNTAG
jgi:hypothetical protein